MLSRREFIRNLAITSSSLPLFNIVRAGTSPNSMLNHASFGGGGKAFNDITLFMGTGKVNLIAVAEVDETRLVKLKEAHPDVKVYKDWRVLLDKEGHRLDSVNVSTPDHMHAPMAISAMQLGINVYGQKPLAHTLYETRRMAEIAKEKKLVTQMGTQLTSSTYERLAARMIQDGVIGKVKEVFMFSHKTWGDPNPLPDRSDPVPKTLEWDMWCGVAKKRPYIEKYYTPGNWRKRLDFGTGTLGDMGCHIYSPMFQALGLRYPISVKSVGGVPNATNWAIDEKFVYIFPGNNLTARKTVKVTWCDGSLRPPARFQKMFGEAMPKQGSIFVGTDGVLLQPHQELPVPYPLEKYVDYRYPKFEARRHYHDYIAAIQGENIKPLADFADYGGPLTETVLLGALSSHFPNQILKWDAENLRIKNSPEANELIKKSYRKGWEVKGLSS